MNYYFSNFKTSLLPFKTDLTTAEWEIAKLRIQVM